MKKINHNGDAVIAFGSSSWVFNPACCVPAPEQDVDAVDGIPGQLLLNLQDSKLILGCIIVMLELPFSNCWTSKSFGDNVFTNPVIHVL